jgi:hypothetical protein
MDDLPSVSKLASWRVLKAMQMLLKDWHMTYPTLHHDENPKTDKRQTGISEASTTLPLQQIFLWAPHLFEFSPLPTNPTSNVQH